MTTPGHKRTIQLLSLAAVAILVGMGLTVLMSPSEADPSPFVLNLADGESRFRKVAVPPATPSFAIFELELYNTQPGTSVVPIRLEAINRTYHD